MLLFAICLSTVLLRAQLPKALGSTSSPCTPTRHLIETVNCPMNLPASASVVSSIESILFFTSRTNCLLLSTPRADHESLLLRLSVLLTGTPCHDLLCELLLLLLRFRRRRSNVLYSALQIETTTAGFSIRVKPKPPLATRALGQPQFKLKDRKARCCCCCSSLTMLPLLTLLPTMILQLLLLSELFFPLSTLLTVDSSSTSAAAAAATEEFVPSWMTTGFTTSWQLCISLWSC